MSRVSGKPYFVYVLWSPSGRLFYIGISEDPQDRLRQHNDGVSRWTSAHRPWVLVYTEQCADYTLARRLENELKRQKGGQGFYQRTGMKPEQFRGR